MAHTAYLPIIADRYGALVRHIYVVGLDLTGIDMRAQVRLYGDVPGAPEIDLRTVTNGNAQGLRLVEVTTEAGLPTSHVELVINESTMEGLPFAGEIGDVTTLAWDWQVAIAGRKRRLAKGEFQITGDGVTGAEVAPTNRIQPYGLSQRPIADVWSSARMTFGEEQVTVQIDGADLVAPLAKKASDAAVAAEANRTGAELAAATALASSRYFPSKAAGEAGSANNQLFSTDDGAGSLIYYKRTSGGSAEIGRAVTPAALAAADGASRVGFRQPGGVARTLQDKASDIVAVKDFGARGDAAQNDSSELQAAVNSLGLLGGRLDLNASSRFLVSETSESACINLSSPIALAGKGGLFSAIMPTSDTATGVAAVSFIPSAVPGDFSRFDNIYFGNPFNGTRGGGIGLRIRTFNAGITAGRILVEGCFTAAGNDTGFVHENDDTANLTGGLFCSEFRRNVWVNGMRFGDATHGTGDSLLFTTNTTTGAGYGVEFTGTIDAAGNTPSQAVFLNHNSTSQSGSFLFHRANFPTIQNANMEQTVSNPGGTLVNFLGDRKPNNSTGVRAPSITNSLVSAFGGVALDALVRFGSTSGGVCFNNWFLDGGGGATYDIVVSPGARDAWIGPNLSVSDDLRILDNGVGTRGGNNKALVLESSWIAPGNGEASAYAYKTIDGEITVSGGAKNGSTTPGAPVMIMPEGFRPLAIELKQCLCFDNGSWTTTAVVSFNPNGEVKIVYCPNAAGSTQKIYFNVTFRAAHPCTIKVPTPFVV